MTLNRMDKDIRVLIDFGSTYTKVVAIDLDKEEILGQSRVASTVATDITIGLKEAMATLSREAGISDLAREKALACSSAAGGLRMVCVGFVPEYTSQAASLAALGAGAKVVGCFSYELEENEVEEIEGLAPDILLLTGGTNGGNTRVIVHNAEILARTGSSIANIIVAGNKAAYGEIRKIFDSRKNVIFTRNVMPEIGKLDLAPCNAEIRRLFMKNIIEAKGIARARRIVGDVIMPTPFAVLEAARIISRGHGDSPGFGELVVVDTGGATTNVHSIAHGSPQRADSITVGLPEPYEKRTVEGDLGLKYNLATLVEMLPGRQLSPRFGDVIGKFKEGELPKTEEELDYHKILSYLAVETAVGRHAGKIEESYGPAGRMFIQRGKDLTGVGCVIGTGGALAFADDPAKVLKAALFDEKNPAILKPKAPQFFVDNNYILYAVGLLGQGQPEKAVRLARKYLKKIKRC
jgi:uncharacterized protein (TIGR01319 family)